MPSKLDALHGSVVLIAVLLAIYALGKITAYGLSGGTEGFPAIPVILGLAGIIVGLGTDLYYKYAKEQQKYENVNDLELLQQAKKELRDRSQRD